MNVVRTIFCCCILLSIFNIFQVESCSVICAGKKATKDGSVLIAHTDDAGDSAADLRLIYVPARDHKEGTMRPVYNFNSGYPRLVSKERGPMYEKVENSYQMYTKPMGYIPEVRHTYAYFDQDYGLMNEKQLMIAESTCGAKTVGWARDKPYGYNLFGIAELTKIALERCDSARCAIQTMGDLAVQYGFFSEDSNTPNEPGYEDSAEALGIGDRYGEVWIFHIMTGPANSSAIWVAQRIPDSHVTVLANGFVIRQINLNDTDHFMASKNIYEVAESMGWYDSEKGEPFDFTSVYGYNADYPFTPLYVGRRTWRVFDLVAPSLHLDSTLGYDPSAPTYPLSVLPDILIDVTIFQSLLSDYFQNTPYDMSQGLAAGPWHMPIRYDGPDYNLTGGWERPLSMYRTLFSFVLVSTGTTQADSIAGTIWYGQSSPHGTVYVPFSCVQNMLPPSYSAYGKQSEFSFDSAWWAFSLVNNWSYLRYSIISIDLLAKREELQKRAFGFHQNVTQDAALLYQKNAEEMEIQRYLGTKYNGFAEQVVKEWWKLAFTLISKYSDGFITSGEGENDMDAPGYPKWFLVHSEYSNWPGNTYRPNKNRSMSNSTLDFSAPPHLTVMETSDSSSDEEINQNRVVRATITHKRNRTGGRHHLINSSHESHANDAKNKIMKPIVHTANTKPMSFMESDTMTVKNMTGGLIATIMIASFFVFMLFGFLYGTYLARRRHGYYRLA